MNGSTVLLPTTTADLHLPGSDFNYRVFGFSIFGGAVDTTSAAMYDFKNPGVSNGQFALLPSGGSATIPLSADFDKLQSAPALGWLSVNLDDAAGAAQADEIPLGTLK
jgi:hypothetical protein